MCVQPHHYLALCPVTFREPVHTFSRPTGALFLGMAFFLFLPMIILAPAKFAMTFSIGSGRQAGLELEARHSVSCSFLHHTSSFTPPLPAPAALVSASLGALKGWKTMFGHLASRDRLPFTAAYFGSLVATLYASLIMHSYLLSLLFCGAQVTGRRGRGEAAGSRAPCFPARLACQPSRDVPPPADVCDVLTRDVVLCCLAAGHPALLHCLLFPWRHCWGAGAHAWGATRGAAAAFRLPSCRSAARLLSAPQQPSCVPLTRPPTCLLPVQSVLGFAGRASMSLGSSALRATFSSSGR